MNARNSGGLRLPKYLLLAVAGVLLGWAIVSGIAIWPAISAKLQGNAPDCPWGAVFNSYRDNAAFDRLVAETAAAISPSRNDDANQLELLNFHDRAFWIKTGQEQTWSGRRLLAYLLAEHTLLGSTHAQHMVRPGDIVLDCGAHVGVFTYFALRRGASRVIAFEPDPTNMECFRRNFATEISSGRVVPLEKGVWDKEGELVLKKSTMNSGSNTLVGEEHGPEIKIAVTTIDRVVDQLGLPKVDYIKMDIEGAEREALQGAQQTLRKYRPRLMLDAYHLPDDPTVLPALVRQASTGYVGYCGPCEMESSRLIPHAMFFRP